MKLKQIELKKVGIDQSRFIKVNIEGRSFSELQTIVTSKIFCELLEVMFKEIQNRAINLINTNSVNPNSMDLTEKLDKVRDQQLDKAFYTMINLPKIAEEEMKRRKNANKTTELE